MTVIDLPSAPMKAAREFSASAAWEPGTDAAAKPAPAAASTVLRPIFMISSLCWQQLQSLRWPCHDICTYSEGKRGSWEDSNGPNYRCDSFASFRVGFSGRFRGQ